MKYSLLVPTRARIKGIERLLKNILDTAIHPEELEILFAVDIDDSPTQQFLGIVEHQHLYPPLTIKSFVRQRSEFTNRDYYNWLAEKSSGKYIWCLADDIVFLIKDWDRIIEEKIELYLQNKPDRIICAGIRDSTPSPKSSLPDFACFPLITKEAYNFFGFILHPELPSWGADWSLYNLYTKSNRYLEIRDCVYLDHIAWHTKSAIEDATAQNIRDIFRRYQKIPQNNVDNIVRDIVPIQVDKLLTYLRHLEQKGL